MQKEHNQHNKKKEKTFLSHLFHCPGQLKTLSRVDIKLTTSFVITTLERTERELELELEREREIIMKSAQNHFDKGGSKKPSRKCTFFKRTIPDLFFVYFRPFKQTLLFYNKYT